jgi:hypothetical protein
VTGTPELASTTPSLDASSTAQPSASEGVNATTLPEVATGTYSVKTLLALLPVAPERRTGYERDLFETWIDEDGDGCNARKEVLLRDALIAPTIGANCTLSGGEWRSVYDDQILDDPLQVQIDHVVALAEAWDSGAFGWDAVRRNAFANDLSLPWSLLGVSGPTNEDKGDKDPADWLPPNGDFVCRYIGDWLSIKASWGLTIDEREKQSIAGHTECASTETTVLQTP